MPVAFRSGELQFQPGPTSLRSIAGIVLDGGPPFSLRRLGEEIERVQSTPRGGGQPIDATLLRAEPVGQSVRLRVLHFGPQHPGVVTGWVMADGRPVDSVRFESWQRVGANHRPDLDAQVRMLRLTAALLDHVPSGLVDTHIAKLRELLDSQLPVLERLPVGPGWVSVATVGRLPDGVEYTATVEIGGSPSSCNFQLLPRTLPLHGDGRPLTLLAGSCFAGFAGLEPQVNSVVEGLWKDPLLRPHLSVLLGDNVYLDQPLSDFGFGWKGLGRRSSEWILRRLTRYYQESWLSLRSFLTRCSSVCITDDHEYWNDYPYPPHPLGWPDLGQDDEFRRSWEGACLEFVRAVQGVRPFRAIAMDDYELAFLDCKLGRPISDRHYCSPPAHEEVVEWLSNLRSPGILFVSAPLLAPPLSEFTLPVLVRDGVPVAAGLAAALAFPAAALLSGLGGFLFGKKVVEEIEEHTISGHNFSFYEDFKELVDAIAGAPHDVLVVAGDAHFGRIATVEFGGPRRRKLVEVVTSPMKALDTSPGIWRLGTDMSPSALLGNQARGVVSYQATVGPGARSNQAVEHVTTLQLSRRPDGGVHVLVLAHRADAEGARSKHAPVMRWSGSLR